MVDGRSLRPGFDLGPDAMRWRASTPVITGPNQTSIFKSNPFDFFFSSSTMTPSFRPTCSHPSDIGHSSLDVTILNCHEATSIPHRLVSCCDHGSGETHPEEHEAPTLSDFFLKVVLFPHNVHAECKRGCRESVM